MSDSILLEAHRLTTKDRHNDYGHPLDDFSILAALLNARFGHKLKTQFVAEDMPEVFICAKMARQVHKHKRDNIVDIAGYANTLDMVVTERERRNAETAQAIDKLESEDTQKQLSCARQPKTKKPQRSG